MKLIKAAFAGLDEIITLYVQKLDFDVSTRIGIHKNLKEEALSLVKSNGLKKTVYDKLLRLELDNNVKDSGLGSDSKRKIEFVESGIAIDPKRKNLGVWVNKKDDNSNSGYNRRRTASRIRFAKKRF